MGAATKKQSMMCSYMLSPAKRCANKTKHPSGKCHLHVNASSSAVDDPFMQAVVDDAAVVAQAVDDTLAREEPVLPLPEEGPPPGDPMGTPVMIADGEVQDSSLTAQRYLASGGSGHYDMLHLKLTPEGESKMMDALGIEQQTFKTVEYEKAQSGQHPVAQEFGVDTKVAEIARSYNARLKKGETLEQIREVNEQRFAELSATLEKMRQDPRTDLPGGPQVLVHYENQVNMLKGRLYAEEEPAAYTDGGKLPMLEAWDGDYSMMEQTQEVVHTESVDDARLPVAEVEGRRIKPVLEDDGKSRWSPQRMTKERAPSKMWEIDLGDGYKALYYPQKFTEELGKYSSGAQGSSMRRRMTVISPKDGDAHTAMRKMKQLYMNTEPMTRSGAEFTYLDRNAATLQLNTRPGVMKARQEGAAYAKALAVQQVEERAHEAVGLSPAEQREWLREQLLAADGRALPYRSRRLREAMAAELGYSSGPAMRSAPGYDPTPMAGKGKPAFRRIPEKGGSGTIENKSFSMRPMRGDADERLLAMVTNGAALASQERRKLMGVKGEWGWSEESDIKTRGASGAFMYMRPGNSNSLTGSLYYAGAQAERLASRSDFWATDGDAYGAVHGAETSTKGVQGLGLSAEAMFEDSIDFQTYPPTAISFHSKKMRDSAVLALQQQGLGVFSDGRTAEEVCTYKQSNW